MARTARNTRVAASTTKRNPPLATEHALQCALLEYLDFAARWDVYYFAIPNAGKRTPFAGAKMRAEGLRAGVSDLVFMLPGGRCCWLELKRSPKQKQSIEQSYFQEICRVLDHPHAVAHSFDEAVTILREWDVLPPSKEKPR